VPPGLPREAERPAPSEGPPGRKPENGVAQFEAEVTIVPHVPTNSLLVRATPHDFEVVRTAVELIDVRPRQVLIEVVVAEVRRDALTKIGMELFATNAPSGKDPELRGRLSERVLGNLVVEIMHVDGVQVDALFEALSTSADVKILSRPVLVTANNQEASILVGSERPFIQVARALPTDAAVRDQIVQYRDVGTKLSIIPTINQDRYVTLTLRQEVSAATSETQFGAPVISTREATTRLLVKDGQTVVIGGLIDRQRERVRSGVPLLKDLPLIGVLFGSSSWRTVETELFLFLTPHVLETDVEVERATDAVKAAAPKVGKRVPEPLIPPDTTRSRDGVD
jgi:general secretion pathway protein D